MTNEDLAVQMFLSKPRPISSPCGCMGPRDGEPLCYCAMQWVSKVEDKYYQISSRVEGNADVYFATEIVAK